MRASLKEDELLKETMERAGQEEWQERKIRKARGLAVCFSQLVAHSHHPRPSWTSATKARLCSESLKATNRSGKASMPCHKAAFFVEALAGPRRQQDGTFRSPACSMHAIRGWVRATVLQGSECRDLAPEVQLSSPNDCSNASSNPDVDRSWSIMAALSSRSNIGFEETCSTEIALHR
jgi:hypothetical protein